MGSNIPKSSSGNPVGYRNPGERFYPFKNSYKTIIFFRGFPFEDVVLKAEDGTKLHGFPTL